MQKWFEDAADLVKNNSGTLRYLSCPLAVLDHIEADFLELEELMVIPPLKKISYAPAFAQDTRRLIFHGFGFTFHALAYNFFVDNERFLARLEKVVFTDYCESWSLRVVRAATNSLQLMPSLQTFRIGHHSFGRDKLENPWIAWEEDF
ncbi:unnamed protein product [Bursaphelenchus xylophilus]|uniref:(pine wood nematode) hypothetical protein n=1 Tax=Bursaphelenchus xylophilus TaxID=6326 RepID=A0A1I7SDG3_BURXY|nr:unnamed protein product [Bursaphelenchus xylophilus]CAG9131692.1 unnamed protein product [Bursaphelenchus xylophilus]